MEPFGLLHCHGWVRNPSLQYTDCTAISSFKGIQLTSWISVVKNGQCTQMQTGNKNQPGNFQNDINKSESTSFMIYTVANYQLTLRDIFT